MVLPADPKIKAAAIKDHRDGVRVKVICQRYGITDTTLRMWTDPVYADKRRSYINARRAERGVGGYVKRRSE